MFTEPQILCWGPNIVDLVCQSHPGFGDRGAWLTGIPALHYGFGRHIEVLGLGGSLRWFKILYSFEFLYTLAMASVKYSMYAPFHLSPLLLSKCIHIQESTDLTSTILQHPLPIPHLPHRPIPPHPLLVQLLRRVPHHQLRHRFSLPMRTHSRFLGHHGWHTRCRIGWKVY